MAYLIYQEEDKYHDPRDAVALLVKLMPTILVDWVRGNKIVETQRQNLVARDIPEIILESHNMLVNNTAYIEISFPEFPNQHVILVIQPHQSFVLECAGQANEELLRHAANQVSSALTYKALIANP